MKIGSGATFTVIASVPAELVQHGTEPDLSTITKSLLFSVAHNALTNVVRHAGAGQVVIGLDCTGEELRLSVSDDGAGLPPDHETRGHGFRNMRADAGRMGGRLEVESDGDGHAGGPPSRVEYWVGAGDFLLRGVFASLGGGVPGTDFAALEAGVRFSGYGSDVSIPVPEVVPWAGPAARPV